MTMTRMRSRSNSTAPRFDADTHTYWVDGASVDFPTRLMQEAGLVGSASFFTAAARDRGTRVHAATEAADRGDPDGVGLPAAERGYLESYLVWKTMVQPVWDLIETPRYSAEYRLAGTADRIGRLGGSTGRQVIVDLKTGAPQKFHGLQLAFYDLVYPPPMTRDRVCLYLRRDGKCAQSVTYRSTDDYDTARRLLAARD